MTTEKKLHTNTNQPKTSNQATCLHQSVVVEKDQKIKKNHLADGTAIQGVTCKRQNLIVAYLS
jgi:DNA-directed RNA polymerase beta subunit